MALRILQFGIVFAIGFYLGPASSIAGAEGVTEVEVPLSLQLIDPKDVTVGRGQSATLRCDAKSSSPNLQITWLHNDVPISINDTKRFLQNDGSLYIPKTFGGKRSKNVTGEYRCLLRNDIGAIVSNAAKLKVASIDRNFNTPPNDLTIRESQPAVLFCNIHSFPTAQIKWEHNTVPLPHNTRYVPLPSGALLITKTHSSDAGSYRCVATNSLLKSSKHSKIVELRVSSSLTETVKLAFLPLDISPNATISVGENINLYCAVTGWPIPTVQWLNDDSIVISNSSIFTRNNASLHDTGNYTCTAYNSEGRISQKYSIDVHQKPFFNVTPTSKEFPSARTVRLDCQALGVPEPKVYWLKDGVRLATNGRVKKQATGLVISHTFSTDSGIYQCVAVNAAGSVWTAAQLVLTYPHTPSPPENVQCRSFDETSICLTWRSPVNVSVQAFSVYSYTAMGPEISGPEFVTNMTHQLASGLNSSTNYTFYVRLYSNIASDQSKKVTCETGVKGNRNLQIAPVNKTSVRLTWTAISTDIECNGTKALFKVQWKKKSRTIVNSNVTEEFAHDVTGLVAGTKYEFRVISSTLKPEKSSWDAFTMPDDDVTHTTNDIHYDSANATELPVAPERLEASPISATVVNLTWLDTNVDTKYYSVCIVDVEGTHCEEHNLLTSLTNNLQMNDLKPESHYHFQVRVHNVDGYFSPFSTASEFRTPADVPSPVLDLNYTVVNETAACLHWQVPLHKNGHLTNYLISYTPDYNWPLENWISKSENTTNKTKGCWLADNQSFSTLLTDLESDKKYTVLVRAVSDAGMGKPTVPIIVTTNKIDNAIDEDEYTPQLKNTAKYNQTYGIILGLVVAVICVVFCISCILARKRCIKSRALARARLAASNNYYPAVAHYATESSAVQVRIEDPYAAEIHEIEHLVGGDDRPTHIPSITPTHLDSKGADDYPNGLYNGSVKPRANGHAVYGNVHITENPRYHAMESMNGHANKKHPSSYEEDSNSNVKTSKFQDLQRIFDNAKLQKAPAMTKTYKSNPQCNSHIVGAKPSKKSNDISMHDSKYIDVNSSISSSEDGSLNATQVTCLDNSFIMSVNNRRVSPILGPNG